MPDPANTSKTVESKFVVGLQQYLSMVGSVILLPIIFVPEMKGTNKDLQGVINTTMMTSGITTILATLLGSRLPLVQGTNLCYLFSILFIQKFVKAPELTFKERMQDLRGAVIICSAFSILMGLSGFMSFLTRLISPVVVAATLTAVGISFYQLGFTGAATCIELGLTIIIIIIVIALYAQPRLFQAYAVPIGLVLVWLLALILTQSGAWDYADRRCSVRRTADNPTSQACINPEKRMRACRTDAKDIIGNTSWVSIPYPFQWGRPTFHIESITIMLVAQVIATVDSVGLYHSTSILTISKPPPTSALSRGIFIEGVNTFIAGVLGTGAGATSLTDNIHTLSLTRTGSKKALQVCSLFIIVLSLIGKVGALIASMPPAIAFGILVFLYGLNVAIGISNMRFTEMSSGRNLVLLGTSVFLGQSIAYYFQNTTDFPAKPIDSSSNQGNKILNGMFSLQMFNTFLLALLLEATVPGTAKERGLFVWAKPGSPRGEPAALAPYNLWFKWANY